MLFRPVLIRSRQHLTDLTTKLGKCEEDLAWLQEERGDHTIDERQSTLLQVRADIEAATFPISSVFDKLEQAYIALWRNAHPQPLEPEMFLCETLFRHTMRRVDNTALLVHSLKKFSWNMGETILEIETSRYKDTLFQARGVAAEISKECKVDTTNGTQYPTAQASYPSTARLLWIMDTIRGSLSNVPFPRVYSSRPPPDDNSGNIHLCVAWPQEITRESTDYAVKDRCDVLQVLEGANGLHLVGRHTDFLSQRLYTHTA